MNSALDFAAAALGPLFVELGIFLPRLLLALLIAGAGWLLAKALRFTVIKALRSINFHVLSERSGVDAFLQMGGRPLDTCALLGLLAYWLAIVLALVLAFNSLGLAYASDLLTRVALFVPRLVLAIVIVVFGAYFARVLDTGIAERGRRAGFGEAPLLGRLARYAVLLFVVLAAFDQLAIGGDIIRQSFLIILAGVVFALAPAFGLGGRHWAAGTGGARGGKMNLKTSARRRADAGKKRESIRCGRLVIARPGRCPHAFSAPLRRCASMFAAGER